MNRSLLLFVLISFLSLTLVRADGNPGTDAVASLFPYSGTLEKDGAGISGAVEMELSIYDAAGSATVPVWVETQAVQVHRGRFTVLMGLCDQVPTPPVTSCPLGDAAAGVSIEDVILYADDLLLGIVLNPRTTPVPLVNRKRFLPVPYAVWSRAAADLKVAGTSTLGGKVTAGQDLAVTRNATVSGDLTVMGRLLSKDGDLACPNNTRSLHGQCWFIAGGNVSHRGAAQACAANHARLCTVAEAWAIHSAGGETCQWTWLADKVPDGSTAAFGLPRQVHVPPEDPGTCGYPTLGLQQRVPTENIGAGLCCK